MREYVKPMMYSEFFMANEYFSACGDYEKFACLNMNNATAVYYDSNMNGYIDEGEGQMTGWTERNDCGTTGDSIARIHEITTDELNNLSLRVIVKYRDGSVVSAVLDEATNSNRFEDSPHFISLKEINRS